MYIKLEMKYGDIIMIKIPQFIYKHIRKWLNYEINRNRYFKSYKILKISLYEVSINHIWFIPNFKKWINKDWTIPQDVKNIPYKTIEPRCLDRTPHFINADGIYSPCCWIAVHPDKNPFYKHRDKFDISKNTLNDILTAKKMIEFEKSLESFDSSNDACKRNCSKSAHSFSKDNPSMDSSRETTVLK